jgi:hypothetical protein
LLQVQVFLSRNWRLISSKNSAYQARGRFLVYRGSWVPLRPTFWLENLSLWSTELYKTLGAKVMKIELTYLASKKWEKLGVKNCAQLPMNKKTTPDHTVQSNIIALVAKWLKIYFLTLISFFLFQHKCLFKSSQFLQNVGWKNRKCKLFSTKGEQYFPLLLTER